MLFFRKQSVNTKYGKKRNKRVAVFSTVALLVVVVALFFAPLPLRRVCITAVHIPGDSSRLHVFLPEIILPQQVNSDGFIISYTHSVNKGRVQDFYSVNPDNTLCLHKTRFLSYGAGMPEPEDATGLVFIETDDYIEIQNINRNMPFFTMAVGVIARHAIEIENGYYSLTDFFTKQTRVKIEYRRVTAYELLHSLFQTR